MLERTDTSNQGCKWIFSDRIQIWSGLEGFLSVHIWSRVFNIHNRSVSKCSKITFYDVDIYYKFIISISIRSRIFNIHKYDINNTRTGSVYIPADLSSFLLCSRPCHSRAPPAASSCAAHVHRLRCERAIPWIKARAPTLNATSALCSHIHMFHAATATPTLFWFWLCHTILRRRRCSNVLVNRPLSRGSSSVTSISERKNIRRQASFEYCGT